MSSSTHGFLIAIEGLDGAGKSTIAKLLAEKIRTSGYEVLLTKEPGSKTALGQSLRTILQQQKSNVCSKAEFLLFAADRAQHFHELVIPALRAGKVVISDRMADSSLAYQGYGRELSTEAISYINTWCMGSITPDVVLYLTIDQQTAEKRIKNRQETLTTFEREDTHFWSRVSAGFETIFENRNNVIPLSGTQTPEDIVNTAYNILRPQLP